MHDFVNNSHTASWSKEGVHTIWIRIIHQTGRCSLGLGTYHGLDKLNMLNTYPPTDHNLMGKRENITRKYQQYFIRVTQTIIKEIIKSKHIPGDVNFNMLSCHDTLF